MQLLKKIESLILLLKQKSLNKTTSLGNITGPIVVFNTESIYYYLFNQTYREYVSHCNAICVDGSALAIAFNIFGFRLKRYHGPDLLEHIVDKTDVRTRLLVGGDPMNHANLRTQGIFSDTIELPMSDNLDLLVETARKRLRGRNERYIFISLGLPKQESLANQIMHVVSADSIIIPIGAAADFITGHRKRAGKAWQSLGLEWLPRLLREPRMFVRNVRSLFGLILLILGLLKITLLSV